MRIRKLLLNFINFWSGHERHTGLAVPADILSMWISLLAKNRRPVIHTVNGTQNNH